MSIVRCPHCGINNRACSNFCNNCGAMLVETAPPDAAPATPPDAPQNVPANTTADADPHESSAEDIPAPAPDNVNDAVDESAALASPENEPDAKSNAEAEAQGDDHADELFAPPGKRGLLAPLRVELVHAASVERPAAAPGARSQGAPDDSALSDAQVRQLRRLMREEPALVEEATTQPYPCRNSLRIGWIYWLIGLALALPLLLNVMPPLGQTQSWPGVQPAFAAVEGLASPQTVAPSRVLIVWGYDPATAGEMDIVAQPVIAHLLARRTQLVTVSLIPTGPASARRLIQQAGNALRLPGEQSSTFGNIAIGFPTVELGYLPGGTSALPLLAIDGTGWRAPADGANDDAADGNYQLIVVVAAQAEDVVGVVEQVQTLNNLPVLAVVSAAADPTLRPYYDSGQLAGLVSGFDGAAAYLTLYEPALAGEASNENLQQRQHFAAQSWGHIAILGIIVLGNLALLANRSAAPARASEEGAQDE